MILRLSGAAAIALIASAHPIASLAQTAPAKSEAAPGKPRFGSFGFDEAGMDKKVLPGDDFYDYANGSWDKNTQIPADRASWGNSGILRDLADQRTRSVIEDSAKTAAPSGSAMQKVGDFYGGFMDEAAIEAKGIAPLKPQLDAIAAAKTPADLARLFGTGQRIGLDMPIGVMVEQDLKNNAIYAAYIGQGGLGLPDRDYYLVDDNPKFAEARTKYQAYIAQMLTLAGVSDAAGKAQRIYALEVKIAKTHWTRTETRQLDKLYNPVAVADLAKTYPGFDWTSFLAATGLSAQPQLVVMNPSAITAAAQLVASEPIATWQDYLTFQAISDAAPLLPKAFVDANFAMYGNTLSGTPQIKERWKRGVDLVNGGMGEAVGELYVARYFPPEAKAKMEALVENLRTAFDARLGKLAWMAPETKARARTKLAAFTSKVGYPDSWRDYSRLEIRRDDPFGNAQRATAFEYERNLAKIGKPVDKNEWQMTPQTVNAYANPLMNEVVFPAGILQAPYFDLAADDAVNYGAIGAIIGHELSHHFDDQGSKFDPQGNMKEWWTAEDVKRFNGYTGRVVAQYGAYEPLPGVKVNGELTLGENMADLAGLNIAYDAYHLSLKGKKAPVIDGYTGDQRFFLGFAQAWRTKMRDAALQQQITTDPHTPGHYRAYVVRNLDAWYDAFGIKPGTKFYLSPEQRIKVW